MERERRARGCGGGVLPHAMTVSIAAAPISRRCGGRVKKGTARRASTIWEAHVTWLLNLIHRWRRRAPQLDAIGPATAYSHHAGAYGACARRPHWSNERTMAYPVNAPLLTRGQERRSCGGRPR